MIDCFVIERRDPPGGNGRYTYILPDGREVQFEEVPPGALWKGKPIDGYAIPGDDGEVWYCMTPGGAWCIDSIPGFGTGAPSDSNPGRKWQRTGTAPKFTVTPSIVIGRPEKYHGWLRDGQLIPC
jgi:hypothetical protein